MLELLAVISLLGESSMGITMHISSLHLLSHDWSIRMEVVKISHTGVSE